MAELTEAFLLESTILNGPAFKDLAISFFPTNNTLDTHKY